MGTQTSQGADRIRIEVETDGKVRTIELAAPPGGKLDCSLGFENEIRELPTSNPWREWEPTGNVTVKLEAYGPRVAEAGQEPIRAEIVQPAEIEGPRA
jgi:hypothetical protein